MRRIMVNHARNRNRLKRGGGRVRLDLLDQGGSLAEDPNLVLPLDDLLTRLAEVDAGGITDSCETREYASFMLRFDRDPEDRKG